MMKITAPIYGEVELFGRACWISDNRCVRAGFTRSRAGKRIYCLVGLNGMPAGSLGCTVLKVCGLGGSGRQAARAGVNEYRAEAAIDEARIARGERRADEDNLRYAVGNSVYPLGS